MQKLVEGIHNFFSTNQKQFETLVEGQQPLALLITCSDSQIDPNRLTQTKPGQLFLVTPFAIKQRIIRDRCVLLDAIDV